MSAAASTPTPPREPRPEYAPYSAVIDRHIESTRRGLKLVELAAALLILAVVSLGCVLAIAVVEHSLFAQGMPAWLRGVALVVFVLAVGRYVWRCVLPLLLKRINPAYAASAIERDNPTLKNSLLSFLQLRPQRTRMPRAVLEAVEAQAARGLSGTDVDVSVDRTQVIRAGAVLAGILLVLVVYSILSPKSLGTSAARFFMPWADIAPPSRVQISGISPGNADLVQGDRIEITATISRLAANETVELLVRPDVGEAYRVPMRAQNGSTLYTAMLPADELAAPLGLQHSFDYRIIAGDAQSQRHTIAVAPAPTIRVVEVRYDFPDYTGYVDRTVEGLADLRAVEGTEVTIVAESNVELSEAHIDFDADGRNDLRMQVAGTRASKTFRLEIPTDGRPAPASYVLRIKTVEGADNRQPPLHNIEIVADLPPEIEIVSPDAKVSEVAVDQVFEVVVEARDPDFALSQVELQFSKPDGTQLETQSLLSAPHQGRLQQSWQRTPQDLGLKPGEVVTYWARALDNRTPRPGQHETDRRELRVIGPASRDAVDNPQPGAGGQAGEPNEQAGAGDGQQQPRPGEQGGGNSREGQAGEGQSGEQENGGGESQSGDNQNDGTGDNQSGAAGGQSDSPNNQNKQNEQNGDNQGQSADGNAGNSGGQPSESKQDAGQEGTGENQPGMSAVGGEGADRGNQDSGGGQPSDGQNQGNNDNQSAAGGNRDASQKGANGSDPQADPNRRGGESSSQPVANDGSNDAEAFERIRRHLSDQERQQSTQKPSDADASQATGEAQAEPADNNSSSGQPQNSGANDGGEKPQQNSDNSPGEGADSGNQSPGDNQQPNASEPQGGTQSSGKRPDSSAGDSQSSADPAGSPEAQRESAERNQSQKPDGEKQGNDPAQSPGISKHESDSEGETGGDRAGDGAEGGGQQAPRDGTGSDGQNQAADNGAGQSGDQGPGQTGEDAGTDSTAGRETGESGSEPGTGSQQRPGGNQPGGQQPSGQQPGNQQPGDAQAAGEQPQAGPQGESPPGQPADQQQAPLQDGRPGGGARPTGGNAGPGTGDMPAAGGEALAGDEANLDYAREQTNLMLETLDEQLARQQVDPEMLDDLGWTPEQLKDFVSRWQQRKQAAAQGDDKAQVELDQALRSIGLKPGNVSGATNRTTDNDRNLTDGYRRNVPAKYRDRMKWYTEGLSRGRAEP